METQSKKKWHRCCICKRKADLELASGKWICEECAQIQCELAEMQDEEKQ